MRILNLYHSQTGNTEKIARQIACSAEAKGHSVDTPQAANELEADVPVYDFFLRLGRLPVAARQAHA